MIEIIDFGIKNYGNILSLQEELFSKLIKEKKEGKKGKEYILIGEHNPVITLGRKAQEKNVLISESQLLEKGIELYHIGRGGDVTYHCQGQMIVYPILDLERHNMGVKDYVNALEESIIRLLEIYNVKGERVDGATGVWIDKEKICERKICAIGIKCSRFCTMHGLALNVKNDLSGFSMINPCGFIDKGVTSLQIEMSELSNRMDMEKIKKDFLEIFLGLIFPFEEVFYFSE